MAKQNKTLGEILKDELIKILWGIVAAALTGLVVWYMAVPLLKKQFEKLGHDVGAPSSQVTNDNKVAK